MPSEHAELPQFFDTVEKLFTIYQVPADVQAKLLIPILSSQAKTIIGRMTSDDLMSYDNVKQFLLTEFRQTPKEYKVRFDTSSKNVNETYVLFTSRLGNLLSYRLRIFSILRYINVHITLHYITLHYITLLSA